MISFKNQNLQNRSFQGQVLHGADFSGADLRGCNFNRAQLEGANFEHARIGLLPRKLLLLSGVMVTIALFVTDALFRLIFSALGQIPNSPAWSFVLLLYGVLSWVGASMGVSVFNAIPAKIRHIAHLIAAILSGALLGFFYAGSASGNNPNLAIGGAVVAGLGMAGLSQGVSLAWIQTAIATLTTVTVYAAAFLLGATASISLSAQQFGLGVICAIGCLGCVGLAWSQFKAVVRSLKRCANTSFEGAELTGAKFDRADGDSGR
jgi:uncharacterized protein YjbI with pentapeptide repeats